MVEYLFHSKTHAGEVFSFLLCPFFSLYLTTTQEFDWYSIITHFPSLTTLEGPRFLFGTRSSEANSETICELLRLCPKMRRLSLFQSEPFAVPESPRYAVIIEREGNSVRWDVRLRFPDEEGAVDHNKGSGSFEL